jgi:cardiolipin synthase A/B
MSPFQEGHQIELLQGSRAFFPALVQAIDAAQREVRMETYLFDFALAGQSIAKALIRAAERGVRVQVLVDGAGTEPISEEWLARFEQAGVQWRVYNPLGRFGFLLPSRWRRLHRKLCVIDGGTPSAIGFCGGINVLDDFHDPNHGALKQPRFDFSAQIQGPLVQDILDATSRLWLQQTAFAQLRQRQLKAAVDSWASSREKPMVQRHQRTPLQGTGHFARAALLLRDNLRYRKRIERAYLKAISDAQQDIIIANAYFLPGRKLRKALLLAAKRGVKIKLLLQGRYEYFMQYHAARPVYSNLLEAGIEIVEYKSSFLHAKVAVIDAYSARAWATVGSSNLDPLSLLLAREANIVVLDGAFARDLRERLVAAMLQDGDEVSAQEMVARPWHQRFLDRVAFGLMRVALSITGRQY